MTPQDTNDGAYIGLRGATLRYPLQPLQRRSIKADLTGLLMRGAGDQRVTQQYVTALDQVTLEIRKGERVGLVGRNGAGKSSFLRLAAGVYLPQAGEVITRGRIQAIFDIGIGFETDATGRENVFYRGLVMGMHPEKIRERADDIIAFADIGEFIDLPLRAYSSGMVVRLAFAISTFLEGEILLIDEVFGTGDLQFYNKAKARMLNLVDNAQIVCFASHDLGAIRDICNRCLWVHGGKVRMDGPVAHVTATYEEAVMRGEI
jgi:lipopolysaccharide transport system ATP-binding protein